MSPGSIENGVFKLPCDLDESSNWKLPTTWPECKVTVDQCTELPTDPMLTTNFMTSDSVPVNVSKTISYRCKTSGHVTVVGETLDLTCTESGQFELPDPIPSCREPVLCESPPIPSGASRLLNSTSEGVKEWENAIYNCRVGTNLSTDNFALQCKGNGYYDKSPNWDVCNITACVDIPTPKTGYITSQWIVPVDDALNFTCSDGNKIPDHDKLGPVQLFCEADGNFGPSSMTNVSLWPDCRTHYDCETPPIPDESTGLRNSNSTGLKEYHYAKYYCKEGRGLDDAYFSVQCGKVDGSAGKFNTSSITWPTCAITHCLLDQIGSGNTTGFNSTTDVNPEVGETITLKCATVGQITNGGSELGPYGCRDDGSFNITSVLGSCRDPIDCATPSATPIPSAESNLQNTTSNGVKEFEKLRYNCNPGTKLDDGKDYHEIECPSGGDYGSIDWPICSLACDFNIETPPTSSNLKIDDRSTVIRPNNDITYSCKIGFHPLNATLEGDDGETMTIENSKIKLKCNATGMFPSLSAWPNCTEDSSSNAGGRRKRSSSSTGRYSHLQDDIDYTILVLVETQFMWTDGIENEINGTTNKTREDRKEFPMLMVEHFHSTLENGALGPEDPDSNLFNINSLKVKSKTIRPQCEQPINYNYEIINAATGTAEIETPTALSNCIPSGSKCNNIYFIRT